MAKPVAEVLVDVLAAYGVRRIYGVPGDSINPLIEALRKSRMVSFVQVRHEEAGALAASFEAKHTRTPVGVLGTSGPGSIHLLNGLYDAKLEHAPVVSLTGQVRAGAIGLDSPQEVNLLKLFDDVCVFNRQLADPASAAKLAELACRAAILRRGVANLVLPVDLLRASVETEEAAPTPVVKPDYTFDPRPAEELIDRCSRPVVLLGGGARGSSELVDRFAETIGAPVVYALNGKGVLPEQDPKVMGGVGLLGSRPSAAALAGADLLIVLGSSFPFPEFLPKGVPTIQVDVDPENIGKRFPVTLGVVSTVERFLLSVKPKEKPEKYYVSLQEAKNKWLAELEEAEKRRVDPIAPQALVRALMDVFPEDTIVVADVGMVTLWCAQNLRRKKPYHFYTSSWLATMGSGVAGALGVSFATDRPVLALVGDGGFTMTMMEILTAVKYSRPIKVAVFNNQKYGLIKVEQMMMGYPEFGTELHNPNFAALAEAMGAKGIRLEHSHQIESAVDELLHATGPAVLDALVNPEAMPLPPF